MDTQNTQNIVELGNGKMTEEETLDFYNHFDLVSLLEALALLSVTVMVRPSKTGVRLFVQSKSGAEMEWIKYKITKDFNSLLNINICEHLVAQLDSPLLLPVEPRVTVRDIVNLCHEGTVKIEIIEGKVSVQLYKTRDLGWGKQVTDRTKALFSREDSRVTVEETKVTLETFAITDWNVAEELMGKPTLLAVSP